jgi:hypothetical protein
MARDPYAVRKQAERIRSHNAERARVAAARVEARCVGPGLYAVPSSRDPLITYSVQVTNGRGVCDCPGYESAQLKDGICRHVRTALAMEALMDNGNTALAVREQSIGQYNPTIPSMDEMKAITTMANHFYKLSGKMIPASIKTPQEAFAVMVAGRELGLGPMESFREMHVVNGVTMPGYRVLAALVLRNDPGASFKWLERSTTRACVQLTRPGRGTLEVEYTVEDAKRAGLAEKDNWKKHPRDMLAAKAITRACRLGGPDLITSIGASVRGAPTVMRVLDEAIEEDEADALELDKLPEPEPTIIDRKARIVELIQEAKEKWADEDGKYEAWSNGIRERFPWLGDPKKIAKATDEEADAAIAAMEADVMGVVQGSFV